MNKHINIYERDVIVGALPMLLLGGGESETRYEEGRYPFGALSAFFEKPEWIKGLELRD